MAEREPLILLIPKGSDVSFDQRLLGVRGSRPEGDYLALELDPDAIEALAPHPVLGPKRFGRGRLWPRRSRADYPEGKLP
jgi:hypothetical protein